MPDLNKNRNLSPREPRNVTPEQKKLFFSIALNSLILTFIYFGACYGITDPALIAIPMIVSVGYWVAFAAFLIAYMIYNRAFSRKNLTVDMLPLDWSPEKKKEYIEDGKERLRKSKWMLSVIFPLLIPIALDALYLFTIPLLENLFHISF